MYKKIFRNSFLLATVTLLIAIFSLSFFDYRHLEKRVFGELAESLQLAKAGMANDASSYLEHLTTKDRLTWIDETGKVLYDNQAKAADLENHLTRPEVKNALATGSGESLRYSDTLFKKNFYVATKLPDGSILRLATSQDSLWHFYLQLLLPTFLTVLLLAILAFLAARYLTEKLLIPFKKVDLQAPKTEDFYPELYPFVQRIKTQQELIQTQIISLKKRQQELTLITQQMQEGLLLLDDEDQLLLGNPVALKILALTEADYGKNIRLKQRIYPLFQALDTVHTQKTATFILNFNQQKFKVLLNPVLEDNLFVGTVLLFFDVTETLAQEEYRREFAANVTHELKTPLTSISGYSEIISQGLVKPQDIPRFAQKINDEAKRLLALVNDTLKLSRLENPQQLESSEVALVPLIQNVMKSLQKFQVDKKITFKTQLAPFTLVGYPFILTDIFYNLIENALKYSPEKSQITLTLSPEGIFSITDEGPGIPESQQERIFERFYRVDKSHSQQISGTGLGLSIVKHGVKLHGGTLQVENVKPQGTRFTIFFPTSLTPPSHF